MQAVRFAEYGDIEVLNVVEVPTPDPGPGQALVRVKAAGINPGEAKIRAGLLHSRWPATFPSGQGSDLAGVVTQVGPGVAGVKVGDEVIGYTDDRTSQAEYVAVEVKNLTPKPPGVPWEVAGSIFVTGATAYAAVRAVLATEGDTVVVSGATGGVGSLAVQLAKLAGATVIGLASPPAATGLPSTASSRSSTARGRRRGFARRRPESMPLSTPSAAITCDSRSNSA